APAGIVGALLVLAAAIAGVQNAIVHAGWAPAPSWLGTLADAVDGARPQPWWGVVGAAAAACGVWLLVLAVKPRRRTAIAVSARAVSTPAGTHAHPATGGNDSGRDSDSVAADVAADVGDEDAATTVWLRPVDAARLAGDIARAVPAVTGAAATATRKKITVTARTVDTDTAAVRTQITDALTDRLAPIAGQVRIDAAVHTDKVHR
ncbi:DUF6286 domain-containing protein, partial [Tomitella cavernea]